MLVLTRGPGTSLKVGNDVTVTVLGINGTTVRLGVEAPKAVAVHREEVYARIAAEASAHTNEAITRTVNTRKSQVRSCVADQPRT